MPFNLLTLHAPSHLLFSIRWHLRTLEVDDVEDLIGGVECSDDLYVGYRPRLEYERLPRLQSLVLPVNQHLPVNSV